MTERVPNNDEAVILDNAYLTQRFRRFLTFLYECLIGERPVIIQIDEYADLNDLDVSLPNPTTRMMVMVTGQGLASYNGTDWVLCSDDSTVVI